MSKIEIEAGYIRGLETKARGLMPRIQNRVKELAEEEMDKDLQLYMDIVNLLGYISALNPNENESK